jgi:hypothetical protein
MIFLLMLLVILIKNNLDLLNFYTHCILMNFLEKVFDSKAKTILGIGSTLIVASIAYLYKSYSD